MNAASFSNAPRFEPDFAAFEAASRAGLPQVIWHTRPADLDTPVSAMLRLMDIATPGFLLESVEKGEIRGRYSVLGLQPDLIWRAFGNRAETLTQNATGEWVATPESQPSLESFRALLQSSHFALPESLPPMSSGVIGYFAYDMVRLMEELPPPPPDSLNIPDAIFLRPQLMIVFDSATDRMHLVSTLWPDKNKSAKEAYAQAQKRIEQALERLASPYVPAHTQGTAAPTRMEDFKSNTTRTKYDEMIANAVEHIQAGDIFQVVLSQRFSAPFTLPPFALYRALRLLNPSPFLFYLNFDQFQLVGSSPEILVRLREDEVTIRPIAGTRRRGKTRSEDDALAEELLNDPKERSEHLMLLDLGRNDVGRVSQAHSVKVTQHMTIEHYSHVMHIVSNVVGTIDRTRYDALSALIAGFPAGTVSGAPKIRAMEIINALEVAKRSFYAGSVGYFSSNGTMDTCITLRTGLVKDGMLHLQAGGGVVAESTADGEYEEAVNKAKALMRAAEEAIAFV